MKRLFKCRSVRKHIATVWKTEIFQEDALFEYELKILVVQGEPLNEINPSGTIRFTSSEEHLFEVGKEYWLEFSATEHKPGSGNEEEPKTGGL